MAPPAPRYGLAPDVPINAKVNPITGAFSWTPTAADAVSPNNVHTFHVTVTGRLAARSPHPGTPPRMPISKRCSQTLCRPERQRRQCPQPSMVSPVTRRPRHAASTPAPTVATTPDPLVAQPHRIRGVTLVQVGHLAGEELDVGTADPDPVDVDHHLPGVRPARPGPPGPSSGQWGGDDEGTHRTAGFSGARSWLALASETVDGELHDVPGPQPDRWLHAHPDPGRRPGVDQVALVRARGTGSGTAR